MNIGKINGTDTLGRINDLRGDIARAFNVEVTVEIRMEGGFCTVKFRAWPHGERHGIYSHATERVPSEAADLALSLLVRALRQHRAMDRCDEGGGT